jgi:hypothetical protein
MGGLFKKLKVLTRKDAVGGKIKEVSHFDTK